MAKYKGDLIASVKQVLGNVEKVIFVHGPDLLEEFNDKIHQAQSGLYQAINTLIKIKKLVKRIGNQELLALINKEIEF